MVWGAGLERAKPPCVPIDNVALPHSRTLNSPLTPRVKSSSHLLGRIERVNQIEELVGLIKRRDHHCRVVAMHDRIYFFQVRGFFH